MSKYSVAVAYTQSLFLVAFFASVAISVSLAIRFEFFGLIYNNPDQTADAMNLMALPLLPLLAMTKVIGTLLIFGLPQLFQATTVGLLMRPFGSLARFVVVVVLPLTAVVTWYCYYYLTPANSDLGVNAAHDWLPFTVGRTSLGCYVMALKFQAAVTLFSFLYFEASFRGMSRTPVVLLALSIVITTGAAWGYDITRS